MFRMMDGVGVIGVSFLMLLFFFILSAVGGSSSSSHKDITFSSHHSQQKGVLTMAAYRSPVVQERIDRIAHHCRENIEDNDSDTNSTISNTYSEGCRRILMEQRQPLFRGQGTHYVFLWVGTPPQRVSVIVDTGSHHTAFPCVGCNCGKHMDPFFDPKKSSSSTIKKCGLGGQKCYFKQAYSEGSSWHAFKVHDLVTTGSEQEVVGNQSVKFEFGCQDSETGLFRTQNVDGIMGLSAAEETLPYQLHNQHVTDTKAFSLCFRVDGGLVSFGGYQESILHHAKPSASALSGSVPGLPPPPPSLSYVKLIKSHGWFTVKLIDISLAMMKYPSPTNAEAPIVWSEIKSIGGPLSKCNNGKGTIIDSGTTDTYLPSALHSYFTTLFKQMSANKANYKNEIMRFHSEEEMNRILPTVIYRFAASGGSDENGNDEAVVDIEVLPESYMEKVGKGKYIPRIYLTESIGAVLGANFMNNHLIIFDIEQMRVGFAKSKCQL